MSDLKQIQSALHRLFHEEANRIVFWNDPDREFEDSVESLGLDGVTTVLLHHAGALDTKVRIDRLETECKFLLYSPSEEPEYENDWLLDIRLFSRSLGSYECHDLRDARPSALGYSSDSIPNRWGPK